MEVLRPCVVQVSGGEPLMRDELRKAGVNEFCVSLDFPDERHDDFRGLPGLYRHLSEIMPKVAAHGYDDIVLNNCITASNVGEINAVADKAAEWGVNINYSAYSPRRTGCRDYFPNTKEHLRLGSRLEKTGKHDQSIDYKHKRFDETRRYFNQGGMLSCRLAPLARVTSDGLATLPMQLSAGLRTGMHGPSYANQHQTVLYPIRSISTKHFN
jgi:MoaA/NifB/PqqE/SkfB family radical SAM enzyme